VNDNADAVAAANAIQTITTPTIFSSAPPVQCMV
jgi:hypothetical protein